MKCPLKIDGIFNGWLIMAVKPAPPEGSTMRWVGMAARPSSMTAKTSTDKTKLQSITEYVVFAFDELSVRRFQEWHEGHYYLDFLAALKAFNKRDT